MKKRVIISLPALILCLNQVFPNPVKAPSAEKIAHKHRLSINLYTELIKLFKIVLDKVGKSDDSSILV